MMHTKISDPYISKERFDYLWDVRIMIDYPQWVEYINNRLDYFTWLEETEEGKNRLSNIDKIPQSFKDKILKLHDKKEACAEFNTKKGYYEIIINYNWEFGTIGTTFQKIISRPRPDPRA